MLGQCIASIKVTLIYEKVRQNNEDVDHELNVKELCQVTVLKYRCEILEKIQIHGNIETSSCVFFTDVQNDGCYEAIYWL